MPKSWSVVVLPKLLEELQLKGYSPKTRKSYIGHVRRFALFFGDEPERVVVEHVRQYLLELISKHNHSHVYVNQAASALKFLMANVLKDKVAECIDIPRCKKE
ncbi:MAG: phage integrase N-terminal SAM-like domain-containing protein [Firmicutes bacterium]|nr:phage integrase N-terminal SAM-like domain-containing protein [Bacillota bacterium]